MLSNLSAKISSLVLPHTGSTYASKLDLTTSKLILETVDVTDKGNQIAAINAAITAGAAGNWTGNGLTSSTVAGDSAHYGIALCDIGFLQLSTFGGLPVDPNSLLVTIAHLGDANGNGVVDIQDQSIITNRWQQSQTHWDTGDLNRDGFVDIQDLTIVTNNWQQQSACSQTPDPLPLTPSAVPEPLTLPLLTAPLFLLRRHVRRPQPVG